MRNATQQLMHSVSTPFTTKPVGKLLQLQCARTAAYSPTHFLKVVPTILTEAVFLEEIDNECVAQAGKPVLSAELIAHCAKEILNALGQQRRVVGTNHSAECISNCDGLVPRYSRL